MNIFSSNIEDKTYRTKSPTVKLYEVYVTGKNRNRIKKYK